MLRLHVARQGCLYFEMQVVIGCWKFVAGWNLFSVEGKVRWGFFFIIIIIIIII